MIEAAIIMPPVISAEGQIGARAEDRDLGHEPDELRRTADPEIPVEGLALHRQGRRLPATPMENALAQHSHRIDHLRISRQRLGRRIGLGGMQACLAQTLRGRFLVDQRNQRQGQARHDGDVAEISVNEEYDSEVEGRERRVHQQKHDGARHESAHLVKAADRLDGPALAGPGVVDAARQHCAAEQGLHLGRKTPQHLPTQNVDDREDADERQRESREHQQCFEAAARQHAVG
jgi:hypothetical protein